MAAAGWYNDELDPALARWHDGVAWTDHVVVKSEWEARGHPPPPPEDPGPVAAVGSRLAPRVAPRPDRRRVLIGSAVVVALVVLGGVALAQDRDDDPPASTTSTTRLESRRGGTAGLGIAVDRTGVDDLDATDAAGDGAPAGSEDGAGTGGQGAPAGSGTTRPPSAGGSGSAVQRTETSSRSSTGTTPVTSVGRGDQSSVGNRSTKTIERDLNITPEAPSPDPPPDGGTDGTADPGDQEL